MGLADRFRLANRPAAWVEVDDATGVIVGGGQPGGAVIGSTTAPG